MTDNKLVVLVVSMTAIIFAHVTLVTAASKAIHPLTRDSAAPAQEIVVEVNPPALIWPAVRGSGVRYSVQLSRDRSFSAAKTISGKDLRWAMFNPHHKLDSGTWYWRYVVLVKGQLRSESQVYSFQVPTPARNFVTPGIPEMLASCPVSHPRVLVTAAELKSFRKRVANSLEARSIVRAARKYIGAKLPSEDSGKPKDKGKNAYENKSFAKWASKALGNRISASASTLAKAYLITGDKQIGREAIRHALCVTSWDPRGITGYKTSDFADGACLRAMTLPYDSCFDLLNGDQKQRLRAGIKARASAMFERWCNNLETRIFSAHIWQHILHEFAEASFATLGEVEDADIWASYVYELWLNRVPLLGGEDGGWANGNNYFSTNFTTLIAIPTFFERLTGVDFFTHPWYRNSLKYMLYTWPPGSHCDGFGDGLDRRSHPPLSRIAFADILSSRLNDDYGRWYVQSSLEQSNNTLTQDSSLRWHRIVMSRADETSRATDSINLPQARLFEDIGVVVMHTDLGRTPANLMLAFRSSPYGSFNHAHADQNTFNILFGGKPLFYTSGYYIGYGDDHFKGWYKHTRGHNGILIDDKGQTMNSTEAYGYVSRYLHGERISYCCGDASGAYPGTGLTRFRRHVAMLRPSTIVIYDELEADHPARWSWLLHSPDKMTLDTDGNSLLARTLTARSRVDVLGSVPLEFNVHNRFNPPAVNWRNTMKNGKKVKYADQWHAVVDSSKNTKKMRYVTIIQVLLNESSRPLTELLRSNGKDVRVGQWTINAQLDPVDKPSLEIRSADNKCALAVNRSVLVLGGKTFQADGPESSILVESASGRTIIEKVSDTAPVPR